MSDEPDDDEEEVYEFEDDDEDFGSEPDSVANVLDNPDECREIHEMMKQIDIENAKADMRPEFWLFHQATTHRIGRCRLDDVFPLIGEWVMWQIKGRNEALFRKPVYVFRNGMLWVTLRAKASTEREVNGRPVVSVAFEEVRTMNEFVEHSILENDLRIFDFQKERAV